MSGKLIKPMFVDDDLRDSNIELEVVMLSLQSKLLRVLEDGSLRRVGCHRQRNVNVRIIAPTNRNLDTEVAAGSGWYWWLSSTSFLPSCTH